MCLFRIEFFFFLKETVLFEENRATVRGICGKQEDWRELLFICTLQELNFWLLKFTVQRERGREILFVDDLKKTFVFLERRVRENFAISANEIFLKSPLYKIHTPLRITSMDTF